jgi:membrane protein implicated in regulation of membrane protease activity
MENPYYIWLILAVLFVVVEIFTAGFFYACFAAGALSAMVTGFITKSILGPRAFSVPARTGWHGRSWYFVLSPSC